jgi:hypothetical protein
MQSYFPRSYKHFNFLKFFIFWKRKHNDTPDYAILENYKNFIKSNEAE